MHRMARYVEAELDRNCMLFAKVENSVNVGIEFIDHVLKDKEIVQLKEDEMYYVEQMRECYQAMLLTTKELQEHIFNYKKAYKEFFCD